MCGLRVNWTFYGSLYLIHAMYKNACSLRNVHLPCVITNVRLIGSRFDNDGLGFSVWDCAQVYIFLVKCEIVRLSRSVQLFVVIRRISFSAGFELMRQMFYICASTQNSFCINHYLSTPNTSFRLPSNKQGDQLSGIFGPEDHIFPQPGIDTLMQTAVCFNSDESVYVEVSCTWV